MNFLQLVNMTRLLSGASGATELTTLVGQNLEAQRYVEWVREAYLDLQTMRLGWEWMRTSIAFPTVDHKAIYTLADLGLTSFSYWARNTFRNYESPAVLVSAGNISFANHELSVGDTAVFFNTDGTGLSDGVTYYVVAVTRDTFSIATTPGGTALVITDPLGVMTMTSSNTTTFAGFKSEIFMDYIDYDVWRNTYQYGALRQINTRPISVSVGPQKQLVVGLYPKAGYTVVGDYYTAPVLLTADTDIPAMPDRFHLAIVYKAMVSCGLFESASEIIQRGSSEGDKWTRRLMADQGIEAQAPEALA